MRVDERMAKLEEKVGDRTNELQVKLKELEKFQKVAVGRELKMTRQQGCTQTRLKKFHVYTRP